MGHFGRFPAGPHGDSDTESPSRDVLSLQGFEYESKEYPSPKSDIPPDDADLDLLFHKLREMRSHKHVLEPKPDPLTAVPSDIPQDFVHPDEGNVVMKKKNIVVRFGSALWSPIARFRVWRRKQIQNFEQHVTDYNRRNGGRTATKKESLGLILLPTWIMANVLSDLFFPVQKEFPEKAAFTQDVRREDFITEDSSAPFCARDLDDALFASAPRLYVRFEGRVLSVQALADEKSTTLAISHLDPGPSQLRHITELLKHDLSRPGVVYNFMHDPNAPHDFSWMLVVNFDDPSHVETFISDLASLSERNREVPIAVSHKANHSITPGIRPVHR